MWFFQTRFKQNFQTDRKMINKTGFSVIILKKEAFEVL